MVFLSYGFFFLPEFLGKFLWFFAPQAKILSISHTIFIIFKVKSSILKHNILKNHWQNVIFWTICFHLNKTVGIFSNNHESRTKPQEYFPDDVIIRTKPQDFFQMTMRMLSSKQNHPNFFQMNMRILSSEQNHRNFSR